MFILSGVTGKTGAAVAETLLAQGKPVTVLVRDAAKGESWRAKGAMVANVSLDDTPALTDLLSTAEGAYLLSPPADTAPDFLADRARFANGVAQAVNASGIPHVVFLSSEGAQLPAGTGPILSLHYAETVLSSAARGVTFLRPGYFLENWAEGIGSAREEGVLHNFLSPGRAIPMVSILDIGRFGAEYLLAPSTGSRVVELAGPADYTPEDIAAAFSAVLGKNVKLVTHPVAAIDPMFQSFGMSASVAALMQEMHEGINSGLIVYENNGQFRRGTVAAEEAIRSLLR